MKFAATVLLLFTVTFIGPAKIFGQDYIPVFTQDYSSRLSVEIDPIAFLFRGYSLHLRYQPMFSEKLLVGLGTYAHDLPETMIDFNSANRDMGWDVRIKSAYLLYGEFYIKQANNGWFIGEQIGFQSFKVSIERELSGSTNFNNVLLMTYLGYSWHPYKGSFYIKPWIGLGYTEKIDGINKTGAMKYDISPFFPYFTFHAGYTF
jgi:hypothetical protein